MFKATVLDPESRSENRTVLEKQTDDSESGTTVLNIERPFQNQNEKSPEPSQESASRHPISSYYLSSNCSPKERESEANFSELDPEFREWLIRKSRQLPIQPTFLEQWIQSQAEKAAVRSEFERWKQAGQRRDESPPPPPEPEPVSRDMVIALVRGAIAAQCQPSKMRRSLCQQFGIDLEQIKAEMQQEVALIT